MFLVDLAVPRDIEMEVKSLNDAYLYSVDDLAHVVKAGQEQRQVLQRVLVRADIAFILGRPAVRWRRDLEPPPRQPCRQQGEVIGQQRQRADDHDIDVRIHSTPSRAL